MRIYRITIYGQPPFCEFFNRLSRRPLIFGLRAPWTAPAKSANPPPPPCPARHRRCGTRRLARARVPPFRSCPRPAFPDRTFLGRPELRRTRGRCRSLLLSRARSARCTRVPVLLLCFRNAGRRLSATPAPPEKSPPRPRKAAAVILWAGSSSPEFPCVDSRLPRNSEARLAVPCLRRTGDAEGKRDCGLAARPVPRPRPPP